MPAVLRRQAQRQPVVAAGGKAEVFGDQFRFDMLGLDRRGVAGKGESGGQQAEGQKKWGETGACAKGAVTESRGGV